VPTRARRSYANSASARTGTNAVDGSGPAANLLIKTSLPLPLAIAAAITLLAGLAQLRARRPAAT
jgi:hypothetical protein